MGVFQILKIYFHALGHQIVHKAFIGFLLESLINMFNGQNHSGASKEIFSIWSTSTFKIFLSEGMYLFLNGCKSIFGLEKVFSAMDKVLWGQINFHPVKFLSGLLYYLDNQAANSYKVSPCSNWNLILG